MKNTYVSQRSDINMVLTGGIQALRTKWPFLFEPLGLFIHTEELLDFNVQQALTDSLSTKGQRILRYLSSLKNQKIASLLADMNQAKGFLNSSEPEAPAIILCVMALLSEESDVLLKLCDEASSTFDVESVASITPCIVGCGNSFLTCKHFMLVIDGKVVNSNVGSFLTALAMLFASFFAFNIEYPREASATLEFIQRCLCRLNPSSGSKTKKASGRKHTAVNSHVLRLIKDIADFEWL